MRIERTTSIEELLETFPGAVKFLIDRKLSCIVCGEPSWGTLEELARDKGWDEGLIESLIEEINNEVRKKKSV